MTIHSNSTFLTNGIIECVMMDMEFMESLVCSITSVKAGSGIGSVGNWFKRTPLIPATGAEM